MARIETGKMLPMETIMKGLEMTLPTHRRAGDCAPLTAAQIDI